jgi:hypothetical protein
MTNSAARVRTEEEYGVEVESGILKTRVWSSEILGSGDWKKGNMMSEERQES